MGDFLGLEVIPSPPFWFHWPELGHTVPSNCKRDLECRLLGAREGKKNGSGGHRQVSA